MALHCDAPENQFKLYKPCQHLNNAKHNIIYESELEMTSIAIEVDGCSQAIYLHINYMGVTCPPSVTYSRYMCKSSYLKGVDSYLH